MVTQNILKKINLMLNHSRLQNQTHLIYLHGKYYIADKFTMIVIDENGNKVSEETIKNA